MQADIIKILGGRQVFGDRRVNLLEEVERGLPIEAYEVMAETLKLRRDEENWLLQMSTRMRTRWKQDGRLDPATSDHLVRLARVLILAVATLENQQYAVEWLYEPSDALGGRTPLAAVASDVGAEVVINMLHQMEHGVYS